MSKAARITGWILMALGVISVPFLLVYGEEGMVMLALFPFIAGAVVHALGEDRARKKANTQEPVKSDFVFCQQCTEEPIAKSNSIPETDNLGAIGGTEQKQYSSHGYTYRASVFSEGWISVECNEADSTYEHEPFVVLVQSIARKWNNNEWQGTFSLAGEMRYRIKNDPLNLVYQWDSLYGIIFEYPSALSPNSVMNFIAENYGITTAK